jgi:hypothetical protein
MKKSTLAAGAAAVLAILTASAAMAQQAPTRGARGDTDGDGRISRAEFVDGRIARLTAIDANRDGSVSLEERQSGRDTRRNQRVSARFETLDKDGDGAVSREEFTATRDMRGVRNGMRGHRGGWGGHRNHGRQGAETRGPMTIAAVETRLSTRFDRVDANHDGYITAEERTVARQAMREQRHERRAGRMAHRAARQASPSAPASE